MTGRAKRRLPAALSRLYPPSWRDRYGEEYAQLLGDTELTPRAVADVLAGALDAWTHPSALLLGGRARLRASVSVVWAAWIVLAAGALIFGQSTEDQPFRRADAAHPGAAAAYTVYEWCAHLSVAAVGIAAAPLVWAVVSRAGLRRRRGTVALMLSPLLASVGFLALLVLIAHVVGRSPVPGVGVGAGWFMVLVGLGLGAGALCAAGPALALRRTCPDVPVLRWTLRASVPALVLMGGAALASLAYELMLAESDPGFAAGYGRPWWQLAPYGVVMAGACVTAALSTRRGIRAAASTG